MCDNMMKIEFSSRSQNESFARVAVAAFASQLDPTMEEISDVKTAVSEAVTNAIIHGYGENKEGKIVIETILSKNGISICVIDKGCGIGDINKAREPLYTSRPDLERSGMGFTVMETFMDSVEIESEEDVGTRIRMKKVFSSF
jgi:stage II sporulation protein AB (anti-sigma F factor)